MIGISVVGAGHWGPNLIRNFDNHADSKVGWVIDQSEERLALTKGRIPSIQTSTDIESALKDPETDALVIATPSGTHFELATRALNAGKHVLVEKPVTTDTAEAKALNKLATEKGLILMVGHVFLYNHGIQRVREYIEDGTLGRLQYISMVRTNLGPIRTDVNAAWDLAAHDISIANYWMKSPPLSVSATGGSWINPGVHDAVFATLEYAGNVFVNLHVSWLNPRKVRDITVVGAAKMLTFDDMNMNEPVRIYDKRVTGSAGSFVDSFASFRTSIRDGDILIPKVGLGEPLRSECEAFVHAIQTGERPVSDGMTGVAVVATLTAMDQSLETGARVEVEL